MPDAAAADEDRASEWVSGRLPLTALVFDAAAGFDVGGEPGLAAALERAWIMARAVATGALIGSDHAGALLFLAPRSDAGPYADAARAALENLARTLSVEWARFGVTRGRDLAGRRDDRRRARGAGELPDLRRGRLLHRLSLRARHGRHARRLHIAS